MTEPLRVEKDGGVVTLTLDRPARRNALSRELLERLQHALAHAASENTRAVVLTGANACFSAGADVGELDGSVADLAFDQRLAEVTGAIRGASYCAIAAVEGPCIGAALDLALACDIRVASPTAFFALPALRLGLLYNPSAVARLWRTLPEATVKRLLLLGERIEGREALAGGIVTHMSADDQALSAANELARSASSFAPGAFSATKHLLVALQDGVSDLAAFESTRMELLASSERKSALAAARTSAHA